MSGISSLGGGTLVPRPAPWVALGFHSTMAEARGTARGLGPAPHGSEARAMSVNAKVQL